MTISAFEIPVHEDEAAWVRARVRDYRWFEEPEGAGWSLGANQDYMRALQRYWLEDYDWLGAVAQLNQQSHIRASLPTGITLHAIHQRSARADAIPLLISHGWPGSVLEFTHIIEELADPDDDDLPAFHVVAPSLPGYAWSDKPAQPIGPQAVARHYDALMGALGYDGYLAQGGDWGCVITGWLGLNAPACKALHLSGFGLRPHSMKPQTSEEIEWLGHAQRVRSGEMGYFEVQSTKPQSLSFAMMDSPMGVAAWLAEKFCTWGDKAAPDKKADQTPADPPFSMDWLLTNIMIYLTTRSFNTASWLYAGVRAEGGYAMPHGVRVETPTAAANYPEDLLAFPPRSLAERGYNIVQWREMPRGGHFASVEEPGLFTDDLRAFANLLSSSGTL